MNAKYKGFTITKTKRGYQALGVYFSSLKAATEEIDSYYS